MAILIVLVVAIVFFVMLFKNPKLLFKGIGLLFALPKLILAEMVKQQQRKK